MAPRSKTVRMSVAFRQNTTKNVADRSIKQQQTSCHSDRQQPDPRLNRLGDKNWDERSDTKMQQVVVCRMNSQSPTMQGVRIPSAILKIDFRHILFF